MFREIPLGFRWLRETSICSLRKFIASHAAKVKAPNEAEALNLMEGFVAVAQMIRSGLFRMRNELAPVFAILIACHVIGKRIVGGYIQPITGCAVHAPPIGSETVTVHKRRRISYWR